MRLVHNFIVRIYALNGSFERTAILAVKYHETMHLAGVIVLPSQSATKANGILKGILNEILFILCAQKAILVIKF